MYNTVLVPLDGPKFSESVLPIVTRLVAEGEAKKVILVRAVVPTPEVAVDTPIDPVLVRQADNQKRAEAERYLTEIAQQIPWSGQQHETVVVFGRVPDVLIDYARNSPAELLVMAANTRRGWSRFVRGSVTEKMLQSVGIPILVLGKAGERRHFISLPSRRRTAGEAKHAA
jgi:nucleotide-binding universal stress UspA family protein